MALNRAGSQIWKSVEVIDDYPVRLNLKQWSCTLLTHLSEPESGCGFISPAAVEKYGLEYMRFHPIGTGPFKITEVKRDSVIRYVKNENYWQEGRPYLDGI